MINNDIKSSWLPEYYSLLENKPPKFLYRVDYKSPEEVFQKGFSINSQNEFNFFDYFFNIYSCTSTEKEDCFINAFETVNEAIINFRKNLYAINGNIKDLYLYLIRCDENFFNKHITRCTYPSALIENQVISNNKNETNKLIFAFSDYGQKFTNKFEWFTTKKISSNQVFSASHIKLNFKKNSNTKNKNDFTIIPEIEDTIFRNPNYLDLNTQANLRAFIYPEYLASKKIEFKNEAYYFEHNDKISSWMNVQNKSFDSNNIIKHRKDKPIVKQITLFDKNNKKKIIKVNFYKEELSSLFYDVFMEEQRCLNYGYKQPKPFELLFTYEKFQDKSVYLNVSTTKKRGRIFFVSKTKNKEDINKIYFDKSGRFIFDFNKESVPFAITLTSYDKSKDIVELDMLPACENNPNQNFHLEHAHSSHFYLKPSNKIFQHLELAIKHNNNSFVFLNPKKKYTFAYDLINLNLSKYSKNTQNFIYGMNVHVPELININLSWMWKYQYFKPNIFLTYNNEKNDVKIEQARSNENKSDLSNLLYCLNTLSILMVDYNNHYKLNTDIFAMKNNVKDGKPYRWLEWQKVNLSKYPNKNNMWVLKKCRYDKDNFYWIISFFNNDYLWVQQKGENWGFFFLANKKSKPLKSSSIFFLNENHIK